MTVQQRILSLRLLERQSQNEDYMKKIGITVKMNEHPPKGNDNK